MHSCDSLACSDGILVTSIFVVGLFAFWFFLSYQQAFLQFVCLVICLLNCNFKAHHSAFLVVSILSTCYIVADFIASCLHTCLHFSRLRYCFVRVTCSPEFCLLLCCSLICMHCHCLFAFLVICILPVVSVRFSPSHLLEFLKSDCLLSSFYSCKPSWNFLLVLCWFSCIC